jgi:hypothetical protein
MPGLPWTRLYVTFPTGPKAVALGVALQDPWAWKYAVRLWCYSSQQQQDGHFQGPAAVATIETAAGWTGSPGELVTALSLPHIQLLDETDRGFYVHDWHHHGGAHIEKLKKDRKRKKESRSVKRPRSVRGVSAERRKKSEPPSLSHSPSLSPVSCNSQPSIPPLGVVRGDT